MGDVKYFCRIRRRVKKNSGSFKIYYFHRIWAETEEIVYSKNGCTMF